MVQRPVWFFDMDNTLYAASSGVFDQIHPRMTHFIEKRLMLSYEEAGRLQNFYWDKYGATFLGLYRHHGIDPTEFFRETHDFDLSPYVAVLVPAARLRAVLAALPGVKAVMTNGPRCYAERILAALQLERCFQALLCPETLRTPLGWCCKPQREAFLLAASRMQASPRECIMVDDGLRNLAAAKSVGMRTVWCMGHGNVNASAKASFVDWSVRDVSELARIALGPKQTQKESRYVEHD